MKKSKRKFRNPHVIPARKRKAGIINRIRRQNKEFKRKDLKERISHHEGSIRGNTE